MSSALCSKICSQLTIYQLLGYVIFQKRSSFAGGGEWIHAVDEIKHGGGSFDSSYMRTVVCFLWTTTGHLLIIALQYLSLSCLVNEK